MTASPAYTRKKSPGGMLPAHVRLFPLTLLILLLASSLQVFAQEQPGYDEISVFLEIKGIGGIEIPAVIKGEELYLPVTDLFDFLKIRNIPSAGLDSISGFFIEPGATYYINKVKNRIIYQERLFTLMPGDLIRTESNLYLRAVWFGRIFGLDCAFNFRNLSVTVSSKLELPLIREMRQEEMRRNLSRLKGEVKADTMIGRTYPMFRFGMADWSVISTEEIKGKTDTRLNLSLGSMIAKGEFTANLSYYSTDPFREKQQYYLWRYVNNDFSPLRQVMAGKITSHAISTIYNPVIGVQFTNAPTTYRKSYGSYTLSDKTEPGWIVELYVNSVLVDYVKADASGFYTFEVPLVYGNSIVRLKFYGPWGEERTREQNINIPFNFLPAKTFEYTASAGIVEDTLASRFSQAAVNYGVTKRITVGGGVEYLSSVTSGPFMPFLNASFRITNNLLLSGEYTYGVRAKANLSYRMPSNIQLDMNYTLYDKDQKAISYNFREERKAALSLPLLLGKVATFQRFSVYQIVLPASQYTTGEWLLSGSFRAISSNITTYALFIGQNKPFVYSNFSLGVRLPARFVVMPQVQYSYTANKLISAKIKAEKTIGDKAYLNLSYEHNTASNLNLAELGFRYDFSFAQTGLTFRQAGKRTSLVQYARGSLITDPKTRYLAADNRTNVGRGGITITAYLDLNSNGIKDAGEPKVPGLNLRTNGGRIIMNERDTTIRIHGLEPYTTCFIELDDNSFENISWRINKRTLSVIVDPDILKSVEVPVSVEGEASGEVWLEKDGSKKGLGRIIVQFTDSKNKILARALTEESGYYSHLGFKPGHYSARIDTAQLGRLSLLSDPEFREFDIKAGKDGDFVEGLNFTLREKYKPVEEKPVIQIPVQPVIKKDTVYMIVHEVTQELVTVGEDSYAIQLGAFKKRSNAEAYKRSLEKMLGKKVLIVIEGDFFKVRIPDLKDRKEVDGMIEVLRKNGVTEL